jgi:penicillin-binding protein 1A
MAVRTVWPQQRVVKRTMGERQTRTRREPSLDTGRRRDQGEFDLKLTGDDRAVPGERKVSSRSNSSYSDGGRNNAKGRRDRRSPKKRPASSRRRRSLLGRLMYWCFVLCLWCGIGIGGLVAYHAAQLPPIDELAVPKRPPNIAILAADGTQLANRGDTGGQAVTIKELPRYLPSAFVAIEDRRFYSHFGIDVIGVARAITRNLASRGVSQGGSTLTQQLAKNLFLTQERTAARKIQEAILAVWLERSFTKDQIIELYLNRVYFGSGAYGVEAAAQRYFGKSARAVSLAEAAMLAGLVQAPSRLAPNRNPEAARARAELVLAAMASEGLVDDNMVKTALMSPAESMRNGGAGSINYAADYVMDVLDDVVGAVERDIIVTTTIDTSAQALAEKALVEELDAKGGKMGVTQGAMIAMTPEGAIKVLIGGRNYSESQFNRATTAKRQPGSAFKPFVFLTALERGLTPDTLREDSAINIKGWRPENYTRDYRGLMTLRDALAQSVNTVAVRLGLEVGARSVTRTAQRLGINSALQPNASIALGTSEVTPLELVSAYAAFANGGTGIVPHVIESVRNASGELLYRRKPVGLGRVIDPNVAAIMNSMMRETMITGTARKADFPGWESAGKTGTSQEFRDAWFVGYTSHLVTGVWLGNDDGTPTKRVSGGTLPVDIWARFMRAAHQKVAPSPLPGGPFNGIGRSQPPLADPARGVPIAAAPNQRNAQRAPLPIVPRGDDTWVPPSPEERTLLQRLFGG